MNLPHQIAEHFQQLHFGDNWTSVCLKDMLADVNWRTATTRLLSFHTIAELVYHINYFVKAAATVLRGEPLNAHDKYSFDCPPITSQEDWDNLLSKVYNDAEHFAALIERLPESKLYEDFWDNKYGACYRNLQGIIEHSHYHLGQIVILKKLIAQT